MGLLLTFGPLQRVPSLILNAIQRSALDQRGTGTGNTLATAMNADNNAKNCGRIQIAVDQPVTITPLQVDARLDWRDRHLTVAWHFDPNRDIRPGRISDHVFPRDRGEVPLYTGTGNRRWALGPALNLYVGPTGVLFVEKGLGFAYLEVTASVQLKERS